MIEKIQSWFASQKNIATNAILSSVLSACFTLLLTPLLKNGKQGYPDLIVGSTTWNDFYKTFDYYFMAAFLVSFIVFYLIGVVVLKKTNGIRFLENMEGSEAKHSIQSVMLGFFSFLAGTTMLRGSLPHVELMLYGCMAAASYFYISDQDREKALLRFSSVVIFPVFAYFSMIAATALLKWLAPEWMIGHKAFAAKAITGLTLISFAFSAIAFRKWPTITIRRILMLSQCATPLLLLVFINQTYFYQNNIHSNGYSARLSIFVGIAIVLLFLSHAFLWVRNANRDLAGIQDLVMTPALIPIAVFIAFRIPQYTAFASDDFHLGEIMIAWQQIFGFHQQMYTDFVSVQGIGGMLYGAINDFLLNGTMETVTQSYAVFTALFVAVTAFLLSRTVGNMWALLISTFILPNTDRIYFVPIVLLVLANKKLLSRPMIWLQLWLVLSAVHSFFNPSVGMATSLASFPFAVVMVIKTIKEKWPSFYWNRHRVPFAGILILNAAAAVVLFKPFLGLVGFLIDNGSLNTTAYGITFIRDKVVPDYFPHLFSSALLNKLLWETFRIGGLLLSFILFWYIGMREIRNQGTKWRLTPTLVMAISAGLLVITVMPYSMGRIDPASINRPGTITLMFFGAVLPVAFALLLKSKSNRLWVIMAGLLLGMKYVFVYQPVPYIQAKAIENIYVPNEAKYVEGEKVGLPMLGHSYMENAKLEDILNFHSTLNGLLRQGETYYDLTDRSLYYYVANKRVPALYSADFLAANERIQSKVISKLEAEKPAVVWAGPSIRHDGGPSSLRSYRIYRWLLEQGYRYDSVNGLDFLLSPDRYREVFDKSLSQVNEIPASPTWSKQQEAGRSVISAPHTLVVNKNETGWHHEVVTVPIHGATEFLIQADPDFQVTGGDGISYVNVDFLDRDQRQIGNYTSSYLSSGTHFMDTFSVPPITASMKVGLVITESTFGTFTFRNIALNAIVKGKTSDSEAFAEAYNLLGMNKLFYLKDIQSIGVAWGRNFPTLQERLQTRPIDFPVPQIHSVEEAAPATYRIVGDDPYWVWSFPKALTGSDNDFVAIDFGAETKGTFVGQLYWSLDGESFREDRSVVFRANDGKVLIPLGSSPSWLLSRHITGLRLDIDRFEGRQIQLNNIAFYKLVK
ncbi:hypothetical protein [Cohnella candidum]|uniref:Uncharacterized protein n=1 Tax=Cohnella candidum TaxID=2674991 RepID=A0A3G3K0U2_9BACL|nr:hypothetical protein [Cohnella candidum]AYQ74165.1 hypothetical protein EAV92_17300 [Cohnella candidum]